MRIKKVNFFFTIFCYLLSAYILDSQSAFSCYLYNPSFVESRVLHMKFRLLLHFVAFFHVVSLFFTWVDNEKALELTNSTVFHRGDNEKALELDKRILFSYFSLVVVQDAHLQPL